MRIEAAFLANHAEVHGGALYVHGAHGTVVFVPELPHIRPLQFGAVLELADSELEDTIGLDLLLRGPDGNVLRTANMTVWVNTEAIDVGIVAEDPAPNFMPYPIVMEGEFHGEGLHLLEFARSDDILYTVRFSVAVAEE